jgi:hypothetical protein
LYVCGVFFVLDALGRYSSGTCVAAGLLMHFQ